MTNRDKAPDRAATSGAPEPQDATTLTREDVLRLSEAVIRQVAATYDHSRDRRITPANVYQPAVPTGRDALEAFQSKLLLPGSCVEGLQHLEHCHAQLAAGRTVLFLPEHRGNLDVPTFAALLRPQGGAAAEVLDKLVYIAGRKLNESSDFTMMFAEKYARLIIHPRRDLPQPKPDETEAQREQREAVLQEAQRINRAAFRELSRLKKSGHIIVLFPLGGRYKDFADNTPVRETTSYLQTFDTAYLVSMEGNTLPPLAVMEEERPTPAKVVFRVGAPLDCRAFLEQMRQRFAELGDAAQPPDFEQWCVNGIMTMLDTLRTTGSFGDWPAPPPPASQAPAV